MARSRRRRGIRLSVPALVYLALCVASLICVFCPWVTVSGLGDAVHGIGPAVSPYTSIALLILFISLFTTCLIAHNRTFEFAVRSMMLWLLLVGLVLVMLLTVASYRDADEDVLEAGQLLYLMAHSDTGRSIRANVGPGAGLILISVFNVAMMITSIVMLRGHYSFRGATSADGPLTIPAPPGSGRKPVVLTDTGAEGPAVPPPPGEPLKPITLSRQKRATPLDYRVTQSGHRIGQSGPSGMPPPPDLDELRARQSEEDE